MKKLVAKQIAAIVRETLERNTKIALEAEPNYGGLALSKKTIDALHDSCANNLGQVLAEALEGDVNL